MGITIDEAIESLENMKALVGANHFAINMAIETMHKYQQIRQIAFPLQFCTTDELNHEAIMKICEVLEDGNNNQHN